MTPSWILIKRRTENKTENEMKLNQTGICNKICTFTPLEPWQHRCTQRWVKGRRTCHTLFYFLPLHMIGGASKLYPRTQEFHRAPGYEISESATGTFFSPYYSSVKEIKNRDRVWVSVHKIVVISTLIIATENYVTICYIYRHILYQLISVSPGEFFSIIGNYKSRNETTLVLKHIIYFWL